MLTAQRLEYLTGVTASPFARVPGGVDTTIPPDGLIRRAACAVDLAQAERRWRTWWEASKRGRPTWTPAVEALLVALLAMRDAATDEDRRAAAAAHPSPPCACCQVPTTTWTELHGPEAMRRTRRALLVPLCADHRTEFGADAFSRDRVQRRLAWVAEVTGVL